MDLAHNAAAQLKDLLARARPFDRTDLPNAYCNTSETLIRAGWPKAPSTLALQLFGHAALARQLTI